jgi:hypothetical protein
MGYGAVFVCVVGADPYLLQRISFCFVSFGLVGNGSLCQDCLH